MVNFSKISKMRIFPPREYRHKIINFRILRLSGDGKQTCGGRGLTVSPRTGFAIVAHGCEISPAGTADGLQYPVLFAAPTFKKKLIQRFRGLL